MPKPMLKVEVEQNQGDSAIKKAYKKLTFISAHEDKDSYDLEIQWEFNEDCTQEFEELEYLLGMQIKLQKKQYVDFMRDITPIFFSLSEKVLAKYCGLKFIDIGEEGKRGWTLCMMKLLNLGVRPQPYWNNQTNISASIILEIMKQKCTNIQVLDVMDKKIRLVEKEVRNLAAHEIIGVTYEWIVKRSFYHFKGRVQKMQLRY